MDDLKITTREMHTGGEPLRIIETGFPEIKGKTILEKRRYIHEKFDFIRKMLIFEPRGHFDMYGVILVDSDNPEADIGTLFVHNEGYSTMCGHAVIALGRYVIDHGIVKSPTEPETRVVFQCPCGPVEAFVKYEEGKTGGIRFLSVPAFVFSLDLTAEVPNFGTVTVDICYGGAFYAVISARSFNLDVKTSAVNDLISTATALKRVLMDNVALSHPESKELAFLYGVIMTDGKDEDDVSANFVVFAEREVERSPCGSGVTARVALQYRRQQISIGRSKTFVGPSGARFYAKPVRETRCGSYDAIVVEVSGKGHYLGRSTFIAEADDEIGKGFLLR